MSLWVFWVSEIAHAYLFSDQSFTGVFTLDELKKWNCLVLAQRRKQQFFVGSSR